MKVERERQGHGAGWRPIWRRLRAQGQEAPKRVVQGLLSAMKAEQQRAERALALRLRVSYDVLARDAIWTLDDAELADVDRMRVHGEVLRDPAGPRTLSIAIGKKARGEDIRALLVRTAIERGGPPFALSTDRALAYVARAVSSLLEEWQTIHLRSRVHTPTDNASEERGIGELKTESGLDAGRPCASIADVALRLDLARRQIDQARLRATRGWRTGADVDAALPRADALVGRREFYAACQAAVADALRRATSARAARAARRAAILSTFEAFGLVRRRGPAGADPRSRPVVADRRAG